VDRPSIRAAAVVVPLALVIAMLPGPARAVVGLPGPPTGLVAAAGDNVVKLTWLPPADDGGAPIVDYVYNVYVGGVLLLSRETGSAGPSVTLSGLEEFVYNTLPVVYSVMAVNEADGVRSYGGNSEVSNEVTPLEGAPDPQVAVGAIAGSGGSVTTDPADVGPTPANPVTTRVSVPAGVGGGLVTIAETTPSEAPGGFVFLGQELVIESTAATDAAHPLELVFRVDPSLAPVTIFRNGLPVEAPCNPAGTATPTPCVASGAGTSQVTVLTAAASVWNVGLAAYAFGGFSSPVDNAPVINSSKAGSVIPVRFGLGGDRGLNVFAKGYPKSRPVACSTGDPIDAVEETTSAATNLLSYSAGTSRYQYTWKTERTWAGTCRAFVARFRDGTEAQAMFQFR
jgi:hypothetical protein